MNNGRFLALILSLGLMGGGCASMHGDKPCDKQCGKPEKGDEADEVKVKFDDLPAAVKATLAEQAPGAKIDSVDKESKKGATVYEADAMLDGKNWEIKVGEDGKLIGKKLDDEKDEGKNDEKEEK